MDAKTIAEKEKTNKKISLVFMIVLCVLFGIAGLAGGVLKFLEFVNNMNPTEDSPIDDKCTFKKDGNLTFCLGGEVKYTYKCQTSNCDWAYGITDNSSEIPLDVPKTGVYRFDSLINDNYAIIYDGNAEEGDTYFRGAGVKIIPIHKGESDIKTDIKALNNYNVNSTTNKKNTIFIAMSDKEKWGIIELAQDEIKERVGFKYDYIGVYVPQGETYNEQLYFAALDGDKWYIISISDDKNEIASNSFSSPIAAYDYKTVVTRESDGTYNVYNLTGEEPIAEHQKNYYFTGWAVLCVYDNTTITIYDTYNGKVLATNSFSQITDVTYEVKNDGNIDFTLNGTTISVKGNKYKKSKLGIFNN